MDQLIETDVLVIGGGIAGAFAALEALNRGVDVLIVNKGVLGKSGCTVEAVYYMLPGKFTPPDSLEKAHEDYVRAFQMHLGDQELMKTLVEMGNDGAIELERMGIYWKRSPDTSLILGAGKEGDKITKPRKLISSRYGETGKAIADLMRKELFRKGIKFLEETAVTSLLVHDGKAVGATALDYVRGRFLVIRAASVIVATGTGGGYLWTCSTSTREMTGDGLAMAYRAGAELMGLEIQNWHMAELAHPRTWNRNLYAYPFPIPPAMESPHFYNSRGERFMQEYEIAPMWLQCLVVHKKIIQSGLGAKRGGYFASFRHMNPQELEEYCTQYDFFKKLGIDTTTDLIEIGFSSHTMCGGIRINRKMETNVPGLFAVGGAAAIFCPTMFVALASGKIGGKSASEWAKKTEKPQLDTDQIRAEEERVLGFRNRKISDGVLPAQIKKRIRHIMYEYVDFVKNEEKLRKALDELQKVREQMVPRITTADTKLYNHDWLEALDAVNMLDVTELITKSSMIRKESRATFQRDDYPATDDENWLRNIVLKLEDEKPKTYTVPVEQTYFKPKAAVELHY